MKTIKQKREYKTINKFGRHLSSISDFYKSGGLCKKVNYDNKGIVTYLEKRKENKTIKVYPYIYERDLEFKEYDCFNRVVKEKITYINEEIEDTYVEPGVYKTIIKYTYDKNGRIRFIKDKSDSSTTLMKHFYDESGELSLIEEYELPSKKMINRTIVLKSPDSYCIAELTFRVKDDLMRDKKITVNIPDRNKIVTEENVREKSRYFRQTTYDKLGRKVKHIESVSFDLIYSEEIYKYNEDSNLEILVTRFEDEKNNDGSDKKLFSVTEFEYDYYED